MNLSILKWPALAMVMVGVMVGGYILLKAWRFDTDAPEANFPTPANLAEARAQDVEHLALFFELERSWTEDSIEAAREQHRALAERAGEMSDAEFELAVARIVAMADNAHTKIREYNRTPRYNRLLA